MRLLVARSQGRWVMGVRMKLRKVSTGTPGGDGAVSRLCQCEHPGCTAALQDVITGGNGVKGAQEHRVISCNCIWLHN